MFIRGGDPLRYSQEGQPTKTLQNNNRLGGCTGPPSGGRFFFFLFSYIYIYIYDFVLFVFVCFLFLFVCLFRYLFYVVGFPCVLCLVVLFLSFLMVCFFLRGGWGVWRGPQCNLLRAAHTHNTVCVTCSVLCFGGS